MESAKSEDEYECAKVSFWIPPLHPKAYGFLFELHEAKIYREANDYFLALADDLDLEVIGGLNPARFGCKRDEFVDAVHPKESCVRKVFQTSRERHEANSVQK